MTDEAPKRVMPGGNGPLADRQPTAAPTAAAPAQQPVRQAAPAKKPTPAKQQARPAVAAVASMPQVGGPSAPAPTGALAAHSEAPSLDEATEQARAARAGRTPFGSQSSKLTYPKRAGFFRRWFNDDPGRIQRCEEAGYTHVRGRDGKPVGKSVGTAERGGGLTAFLMEIPQDLYDEDFASKQGRLDETDSTIMRGALNLQPGDSRYVPSAGISMGVQRGRPGPVTG